MRNKSQFIGRTHELALLNEGYHKSKGQLIVLYGRRRIGKSALVKHFAKDLPFLEIEGLEKESTRVQIKNFSAQLKKQIPNYPLLQNSQFNSWEDLFNFIHHCFPSSTDCVWHRRGN